MGRGLDDADTLPVESSSDGVALVTPVEDPARRFEKDALLGRGGMGAVWQYRDHRIGRKVAMKVLHPALGRAEGLQARFLREAQIQGQLEHPAVVPVYDLGQTPEGESCIAMKQVRGMTLHDVIEGLRNETPGIAGRFQRRRLLADFSRVCLAIDFAHTRGVLHRDLKPANIMLGDFGEVYVLDWGVAKLRTDAAGMDPRTSSVALAPVDETQTGALMGTLGYMSPEQVKGHVSHLGPVSDVYALGAILFELLALDRLHPPGHDAMASTLAGIDARPSHRAVDRDIPPELDTVCARATALDPADRFPTARALHEAIEQYLDGERDLELRREQAARHATAASEAATRAHAGGPATLEARRTAMREIGRALALDPDHTPAIETMVSLLTQPPATMPPEVEVEIDRQDRQKHRWVGTVGAVSYASIFAFLPVMLWVGVRQPFSVALFYVVLTIAAGVSFLVGHAQRPSYAVIYLVMLFSNLAFAFASVFFGPLVLMPGVVAVNATAFSVFSRPAARKYAAAGAILAIVAPFAMEQLGLIAPSYSFDDTGMRVIERALELPAGPTYVFLILTTIATVGLGTFVVGHIRDSLGDAERRLLLYTWHLRELVPTSARGVTDPTLGDRG